MAIRMPKEQRGQRFSARLPRDRVEKLEVTLIGCGNVGGYFARNLAAVGAASVTLYDPDVVSMDNVSTQVFLPSDIGRYKVEALAEQIHALNPDIKVIVHRKKWTPADGCTGVVVSCADSMAVRSDAFEASQRAGCPLFLDGRMLSLSCSAHAVFDATSAEVYRRNLFTNAEGYEAPCTDKATPWCGSLCGGLLFNLLFKHLAGGYNMPTHYALDLHADMLDAFFPSPDPVREPPTPVTTISVTPAPAPKPVA